MEIELIKNKVYYKIFDLTNTVSTGKYNKQRAKDAANLAEIEQNINSIKKEYNALELIILQQVHGNHIVDADNIDCSRPGEGDGLVTTKEGVALGIFTADCVPVLMASDDGAIIGAAHCGWKGAKANIIERLYENMKNKGAKNIKALIAPAIQQKSYEVDEKYFHDFTKNDSYYKKFFIDSIKDNHYMFDLPGYVRSKIEKENIEIKVHVDDDTYELEEKYPSCRRSAHRNESYNQNILSTIIIR